MWNCNFIWLTRSAFEIQAKQQSLLFFIIINVGVRASLRAPQLISRTLKLTRAYFFFITLCCQAMLEYIVALITKRYGIWKYGDITKQNRMELRHPSSSASDTVKWSSSEIKDSAVYCMKCHLS